MIINRVNGEPFMEVKVDGKLTTRKCYIEHTVDLNNIRDRQISFTPVLKENETIINLVGGDMIIVTA